MHLRDTSWVGLQLQCRRLGVRPGSAAGRPDPAVTVLGSSSIFANLLPSIHLRSAQVRCVLRSVWQGTLNIVGSIAIDRRSTAVAHSCLLYFKQVCKTLAKSAFTYCSGLLYVRVCNAFAGWFQNHPTQVALQKAFA